MQGKKTGIEIHILRDKVGLRPSVLLYFIATQMEQKWEHTEGQHRIKEFKVKGNTPELEAGVFSYPRWSCDFKASCKTCEKLMFRSRAAALSHAGRVTVLLTERFTFAMRTDGI